MAAKPSPDIWTQGLNAYEVKLHAERVRLLRTAYQAWPSRGDRPWPASDPALDVCAFLRDTIGQGWGTWDRLQQRHGEFTQACAVLPTAADRQHLVLQYAADLGASPRQLRGDRRALARWFGEEAVSDRYRRRRGEVELLLAFCLDRLATASARLLSEAADAAGQRRLWSHLEWEELLNATLDRPVDARVHAAALRGLAKASAPLPAKQDPPWVSDRTLLRLERLAQDRSQDVLGAVRRVEPAAAPRPGLLPADSSSAADSAGRGRRTVCSPSCPAAARRTAAGAPEDLDLLAVVSRDPSPFVRQQLATILGTAPRAAAVYWLHHLACEDPAPQVRAAALVACLSGPRPEDLPPERLRILAQVLQAESDPFVLRTALHVAARLVESDLGTARRTLPAEALSRDPAPAIGQAYHETVLPLIRQLQTSSPTTTVRRWAAQAAERIAVQLDPQARLLLQTLRRELADVHPGQTRRLPRRLLRGIHPQLVGRVFCVLAQDDYGYDWEPGWWGVRVTKGPMFGFRFWRWWYEMCHPATEKRQAFRHTIGRVATARCRAPSSLLGELSETKVPGEPLYLAGEGGWRPYLPLVDDLLSALDQGPFRSRPVLFYTAEGVTEVRPPWDPVRRGLARLRLTFGFARYAQLRNWSQDSEASPAGYLQAVERLGFRLAFSPYPEVSDQAGLEDTTVTRFFPRLAPLAALAVFSPLPKFLRDFASYFTSLFENSLTHLLVFVCAAFAFFLASHLWSNWTLRRARRRLPLSIGGWGTRGKSGTERLKAALFNALGYSLFSKSTGCEAMFLQGHAYGELYELPLFRPNDKATIWEQRDVLLMASQLRSDVFLWECMGLNPAYVDILQRQWTRDDLATVTNAYPDHEDIQGPAGWNVAEVIAGFIPQDCRVFTCEQQMLPVLKSFCRRRRTELVHVDWLASGLITDDVLARFPYREHPDNIALVSALAAELGCETDLALKEMADRMVPDIGVLKTYPVAAAQTRRLEFSNGMSANERFGTLSNWSRLAFDRYDPQRDFGTWITTVVNNRADRVARSRVFAALLVNDVRAHRHFLIGTNLKGLQGYLGEEWDRFAGQISLWSAAAPDPTAQALETLSRMAARMHQPTCGEHVRAGVRAMLTGVAQQLGWSVESWDELLAECSAPDRLPDALRPYPLDDAILAAMLEHWRHWLQVAQQIQDLAEQVRALRPNNANRSTVNSAA